MSERHFTRDGFRTCAGKISADRTSFLSLSNCLQVFDCASPLAVSHLQQKKAAEGCRTPGRSRGQSIPALRSAASEYACLFTLHGIRLAAGEHFHLSNTAGNDVARKSGAAAVCICHHALVRGADGGTQ